MYGILRTVLLGDFILGGLFALCLLLDLLCGEVIEKWFTNHL